ncbi:hypothetical protein BY458DRAFT_545447 [Sporodiniella umbellata]|nr:hypothetical protein BY458DRAFT_545447 [Sporodiniella umbellata]
MQIELCKVDSSNRIKTFYLLLWLLFVNVYTQIKFLFFQSTKNQRSTAIVINALEPYSRDTLLDAHHERRFFGAATSFPSKLNHYGFLSICQLSTPDGLKLIVGSHTCNFLDTSSLRLDSISVNFGPDTAHSTSSQKTRLFLDVSFIAACKSKLSNQTLSRSQTMLYMYLIKQVRNKFDHLSTYTMCRSQLELQPLTIWTLSDQESSQASIAQGKIGSLLFREITTQVIQKWGKYCTEMRHY